MKKDPLLRSTFLVLLAAITLAVSAADQPSVEQHRQKILGIGGLFFRSANPERLAKWYETNLGVAPVPTSKGQQPWHQEAGDTAFAPFPKDTTYIGKPEQSWMIDFRVADLQAMVKQLRAAGITVEEQPSYPYGDFARLHDPEGNPIELWQPK